MLATSGMVRFAGSAADAVRARWPEVVATDDRRRRPGAPRRGRSGPGIGTDDAGRDGARRRARQGRPAVRRRRRHHAARPTTTSCARRCRGRPVVLTPHAGEFARIAGEVGADRIAAARRAAAELDVTVLLKGNATVVADPDGRTLVHPSTGSWAATAGSGDVLTGHHRRAARRRAGAVVGGRVRGVRARPGGRARGRRGAPVPASRAAGGDPGARSAPLRARWPGIAGRIAG